MTDAVDEAAHALSLFADALAHDRGVELVAILRDLVRAGMREVRGLDRPPKEQEPLHERAKALWDEFRRELRTTSAAVLTSSPAPIDAVRAETLLPRLRALSNATSALGVEVRGIATILN